MSLDGTMMNEMVWKIAHHSCNIFSWKYGSVLPDGSVANLWCWAAIRKPKIHFPDLCCSTLQALPEEWKPRIQPWSSREVWIYFEKNDEKTTIANIIGKLSWILLNSLERVRRVNDYIPEANGWLAKCLLWAKAMCAKTVYINYWFLVQSSSGPWNVLTIDSIIL